MKRANLPARLCAGLTALALALTLTACGASSGGSANFTEAAAATSDESVSDAAESGEAGASGLVTLDPGATQESARKIMYTASLELEATDFDAARTALLSAVEAQGSYLEHSNQSGSAEDHDRNLYYTVRIPAENYRTFLEAAGQAGNQLYLSEDASDITSSYVDVEARLAALENQRDRLNALAETAETTADLLEIESQLSEVQYQLENYTRQLRSMDDQITYSTVDISLYEVAVLTPVTPASFPEKVGRAFSDGWTAFVEVLEAIVLSLVYLWPLVIVAVVVVVVLIVTRPARAARRASRQAARATGRTPYNYPAAPAAEAPKDAANESSAPKPEEGTPKY